MRGGIEPVYIDDLTGVLNRRYLYDRLHYEVEMAERENTSLWMAVIDIDDFKAINDTYGHLEGDNILREVASIFRRSVRATDKVIRFGGDEFVILLTGGGLISALSVLKRVRENIARHRFSTGITGLTIELTISVGLAGYPDDTSDPERLLSLADEALYMAKNKGKAGIALVSDIPAVTLLSREILELFPSKNIVARERELEKVKSFLSSREDRVLAVSGDFGVGKSRFLKEIEQLAPMYSFIPFFATTYGRRGPILYDMWRHFEHNYLDVYPDLISQFSPQALESIQDSMALVQDKRVLSSIDQFIRKVAQSYPVVFILDDLAYSDEESLWAIVRLMSNFGHKTKFIYSTDSDISFEHIKTYSSIFSDRFTVTSISLHPLDKKGTEEFINSVLANPLMDGGIPELLLEVSKGNPMFLEELLKYMIAKRMVYKSHQNWIFRSVREIRNEIEGISFFDLILKRVHTLEAMLFKELHHLASQGKDVSEIWKQEIGVVRKGYLLDIVKALHKEKLLRNRRFYVEDYPNVAVKEIYSILLEKNKEVRSDSIELIHKDYAARTSMVDRLSSIFLHPKLNLSDPDPYSFITEFWRGISDLSEIEDLPELSRRICELSEDLYPRLKKLFSSINLISFTMSEESLLVNEVPVSFLEKEIVEKIRNLFELIDKETITILGSISKDDFRYLLWYLLFVYMGVSSAELRSESISFHKFSPSKLKEIFSQPKDETIPSGGGDKSQFVEFYRAQQMAIYTYLFVDPKDYDSITALKELFTDNASLLRLWLLGVSLNYYSWGLPKLVKTLSAELPPGQLVENLDLLYQNKLIPIQFIQTVLKILPSQAQKECYEALPEELRLQVLAKVEDEDQLYKSLLSLSDLDRWGEGLYQGVGNFIEGLRLDENVLYLFMDSLEMSLGEASIFWTLSPMIPDMVKAFYQKEMDLMAQKVIDTYLSSLVGYGFQYDRFLIFAKSIVSVMLQYEKNSPYITRVMSMLKKWQNLPYARILSDVEIMVDTFYLVERFFHLVSNGEGEDGNLVRIIFTVGELPMRYFLRRLIISEDISSFGYFDLFLARRVVGTNVPPERKQEVVNLITAYLKSDVWYVVRNAMELLSYIISPNEVDIFRPLLYYPNERVLKRLVFILSRLKGPLAEKMLLELLKQPNLSKEIQERIYRVLRKSKDPELLAELNALI